jgi:hypothetical protein
MTGTVMIARTQAEIDALDGLVTLVRTPILAHVVDVDWDQAPILGDDAPYVCENTM